LLENILLFREAKAARDRLHASFQASSQLLSSPRSSEILHEIGEQARIAANARGVRVILRNQAGEAEIVVATPQEYAVSDYAIRWPEGVTGEVMSTGERRVITDTAAPDLQGIINPRWKSEGTRAFCCLPLRIQDETIGVMLFYYGYPRSFPEFELEALQLYANQAAAIYESARRMEKWEMLRQAAETLARAEGLTEVLQQITVQARAVLQADVVDVWPYDAEQARFRVDEVVTAAVQGHIRSLLLSDGIPGEAVVPFVTAHQRCGEPSLAEVDQQGLPEHVRQHLQKQNIRSVQGLTLSAGSEKLGVLLLYYRGTRHFNVETQETARTLATHAALALKQARLLEQMRQAKHAAEVVTRVTALGGSEVTLESIAQGTRDAVGCDAVTLCISQPGATASRVRGVTYNGQATSMPEFSPGLDLRALLTYDASQVIQTLPPEFVSQTHTQEWASVFPLQVAEQKLGIMLIHYHRPHHFSSNALADLQQFAQQVAVAVHNEHLYRQAQKHTRALQVICETGQALTGSLNEREILDKIATALVHLPDYTR
jgi:GAF domain-containing protein